MKVLITGYKGFIGRNLTEALSKKTGVQILPFDKDSDSSILKDFTRQCGFVYHLAAVHRPEVDTEFDIVNRIFFEEVLLLLRHYNNPCPVLLTSSIHAGPYSEYGRSKIAAEEALKYHSKEMNSRAIIYRLTNTFGRYALPNHHSVVANFCNNIARNLPVSISDPDRIMHLYYIDDVIESFISHLDNQIDPDRDGFYRLPEYQKYSVTLQKLSEIIYELKTAHDQSFVPEIKSEFIRKLNETFLYYEQTIEVNSYDKSRKGT